MTEEQASPAYSSSMTSVTVMPFSTWRPAAPCSSHPESLGSVSSEQVTCRYHQRDGSNRWR